MKKKALSLLFCLLVGANLVGAEPQVVSEKQEVVVTDLAVTDPTFRSQMDEYQLVPLEESPWWKEELELEQKEKDGEEIHYPRTSIKGILGYMVHTYDPKEEKAKMIIYYHDDWFFWRCK